ncbi:MAG: HAD-IC family P-type ATPase, partial [Candidatus Micrarchaeota archaeon]
MVESSAWHEKDEGKVAKILETSVSNGLLEVDVEIRRKKYGFNELAERKQITIFEIFVKQFKSLVVVALAIAAVLSLIMQEYIEMGVIILVLLINALIGTFQEHRAEKALAALKKMSATGARVIREGKQKKIFARELVPGDLILLEVGDRVPADGRVLEAVNLAIDESMLTGESVPSRKNIQILPRDTLIADRKNMIYKSTIVTSGRGQAIITETGMHTEIGKIAGELQEMHEAATPLQERLSDFMKFLGKLVILGVFFVIVVGALVAHLGLEDIVRISVAQAVSFIPEGLPIVVTIVLAIGVQIMA